MSDHTEAHVASTNSHPEEKASSPSASFSCEYPAPSPSSTSYHHQHQYSTTICHDGHIPSLATFLHRDIQPTPDGHRLLLPFLTTRDRLRLSECSQGLMDYRYSLSKVKVVNPSPTPGNRRGLEKLLSNQRGLAYLRVSHESNLHVLSLASEGCFKGLKTLDLSALEMEEEDEDEDMRYLTWAFERGGLGGLEELNLSSLDDDVLGPVMGLLKAGACPQLRRLKLAKKYLEAERCDAMVEILESGHLHHLEELDLSYNHAGGGGGGAAIARALQGGACPHLVKLDLRGCGLSQEDGEALGEALRSGSCVKLEDLELAHNLCMGDEGFMAILGALEAGSCPSLKRLGLTNGFLSAQSATALGHALRSGNCNHLEWLDLSNVFNGPDAPLHFLQAIQQGGRGALPNLRYLSVGSTQMDQEQCYCLGEAIGGGALPELEVLHICCASLDDDRAVPTMAGLERGGCRHLKELDMRGVKMGPQGGHALARALASGHLNCLQRLITAGSGVGDEAVAEVIKGLRECHQLRELDIRETGTGVVAGQALIQALQDKAWPELEVLRASCNKHLLSGEGVVVGLVEVLERRAELCPRLKVADFKRTRLDQEREEGGRLARLLGLEEEQEEEEEEEEEEPK